MDGGMRARPLRRETVPNEPPAVGKSQGGETLYLYLVVSDEAVSSTLVREEVLKGENTRADALSKFGAMAYRTTPRTTTGETPFCLVYGSEAVIPTEIGEEKTRVAQCNPVENEQARNYDLVTIEDIRDKAYVKILHYKGLMMKSYNNRVKLRNFQVGDLVLKEVEVSKHVRKLDPSWEGPYKVIEVKKKGTYQLQDMEGKDYQGYGTSII
ncbi:UNVERIFIED_CONTAM: hypothetical protein Sangu_1708200 [Sesamum angustifolium]|uniref:Uncharacterized protein n=1 Tax=Sesamum angustifolium TaxID=2727405 RepID=A0AAW2MK43_9LAMI